MKIAVAVENGMVCGHFGHSPSFSFYEVQDGKIISSENIQMCIMKTHSLSYCLNLTQIQSKVTPQLYHKV